MKKWKEWYLELKKYASGEYGWTIVGWEDFYWKEQFETGVSPIDAIENHINGLTAY